MAGFEVITEEKDLTDAFDQPTLSGMSTVYMERSDPTRNLARFYQVEIHPTLFGEWAVIRRWGRIGTYGNMRQDCFASLSEARDSHSLRVANKHRRGYTAANA